jgi:hypothetical protein
LTAGNIPIIGILTRQNVNAFFSNDDEAGRRVTLRAKVPAVMIPPSPMQFTMFGSALYGELYLGLCRALAAPWLDPGWLVRAAERVGDQSGKPSLPAPAVAVRQDRAEPRLAVPRRSAPGAGQVIEVPAARWRDRRAGGASPAVEG